MILPIYAYGSPVLKKIAQDIPEDYPQLAETIENMFETMESSDGVGLAAPQVGLSIRMFVVDARVYAEEDPSLKDFRKVFINAHILEEDGEELSISEGCLSVPNIHEEVVRKSRVKLSYCNEQFEYSEEWFEGMAARIIQHEYDHLDGILFPEKLAPLKRRLLKGKLRDISKGDVKVSYRMVFPLK